MSPRPLAFAELRDQLGIDTRTLRALMRAGLPHRVLEGAPMFDADESARWLIDTGRAASTAQPVPTTGVSQIARTQAECAKHFEVNPRTVANWLKEPGFPGRPGAPGTRTAYFPLQEIEEWLGSRVGEHNQELAKLRLRRLDIAVQRAELELAAKTASLAPLAEMQAVVRGLTERTTPVLDNLVGDMLADAPSLPATSRKSLERIFSGRIREVKQVLVETLADTDDQAE
ncbi:MAG: helix-turn-helix transcriptional regulator [Pirellulaceae bacterium]